MPAAWQFGNGNANGVPLNNGAAVLAGDASVTISSASSLGSPTSPRFMILLDSELIEVDAVAGNVYSSLLRGQEGTAAAGHAATATAFLPVTAGMLTGGFLRADATNAVESTGTDFKPSGLTGATSASRYVGGTGTDAAPASGTFQLGDFAVSQLGRFYVCTAAGSPGTWVGLASLGLANTFSAAQTFSAAVSVTAELTAKDFQATGVASLGSPRNSRYVGSWTTTGPPTGLTAALGDFGLDGNFNLWACSVAGTPGTWRPVGTHKLDDQLLGGTSALITFANPIPAGYRDLIVTWSGKGDTAAVSVQVWLRFNNVSTATYDNQVILGSAAATTSQENLADSKIILGNITGATATAGYMGHGEAFVRDFAGAVFNKVVSSRYGYMSADTTGTQQQGAWGGKWRTVGTAVTRVDLLPAAGNFIAGSRFILWAVG